LIGDRRFLKKELAMRERGKRKAEGADYTAGDGVTAEIT
jgi:hypothetical protein